MRIDLDILKSYLPTLPEDAREDRELMDDLGLEVKRANGRTFTLELLANRGDHRCYMGVAREIAGRLGGAVLLPPVAELLCGEGYPVERKSSACFAYSVTELEVQSQQPLSASVLEILEAAGLRSVGPVVDATNIANLELGQPTHAFDAAKVKGGIVVRLSSPGETAWPLFTEKRVELPTGTLVIADQEKVLAIAGVIGCEDSKVTTDTRRILLESACFEPVGVNKTSRKLGIQTDASARFERGADPEAVLAGAGRVVFLLEEAGIARRVGPTSLDRSADRFERVIALKPELVADFYGITEPHSCASRILKNLGFGVEDQGSVLQITVPSWRWWDIKHPEDLLEEIGRSIGYNALPSELPRVSLGSVLTLVEKQRQQIRDVLVGAGFYEVITDGFYGRADREQLGIDEQHPLWPHMEALNSVDKGFSLLKNNGMLQALQGLLESQNYQVEQHRVFELTRTFHPDATAANGVCREEPCLWLLAAGPEQDDSWARHPQAVSFWWLKGLLEELILETVSSIRMESSMEFPVAGLLHPYRRASLYSGDRCVGCMGEVHPALAKKFGLKQQPLYLELRLSGLLPASVPPVRIPGARPYSRRSLAFSLPHGVEAQAVAQVIRQSGHSRLVAVDIVDLFEFQQEGATLRSITFSLAYENEDGSLKIEELNAATEELVAVVEERVIGVKQRK